MKLRELTFKEEYRSGGDDALEHLFLPAFGVAQRYDRAVGYFSSTALECFARPFESFVKFGGMIRLVTSVEMQAEDLELIRAGGDRREVCNARIATIIEREFGGDVRDGLRKLAALLEVGRLEIRIAQPRSGRGIYHEKVGVFSDDSGYVAFSGSTNESRQALVHNYECIDVFPSWSSPGRAGNKLQHFEKLWDGVAPGIETMPFPEAERRNLIRAVRGGAGPGSASGRSSEDGLWPHQLLAVEAFFEKRRGVLEMATGTGKTRTALAILRRLVRSRGVRTAIVAADGTDLLHQWAGELARELAGCTPRFRLLRHYGQYHDLDEYLIDSDDTVVLCSRGALHRILQHLPAASKREALIVQDEVHRFGSASHVRELGGLCDEIPWRLGLSATPDREYDQDGNEFIARNVGDVIFRYPLEAAIADGVLCGFDYAPLTWQASADDRRAVQALVRRRAAKQGAGEPISEDEFRRQVARVYKISIEKVPVFEQFCRTHPDALERCIVFLAEKAYGELVRDHIHGATPNFHTYFDADNRDVLKDFASGVIDCLITCHRISEGIDIKSVRTVVLLSSDRARLETVQRIGRCLRSDPLNPDKRALVVDFVRGRADGDGGPNADEERRDWLDKLSRIRRVAA